MAEGRAIFSRVGGLVVTAALESGWAADRGCAGLVRLGAGVGGEYEVGSGGSGEVGAQPKAAIVFAEGSSGGWWQLRRQNRVLTGIDGE